MAKKPRNFRREYLKFQSSEKAKKDRAARNAARRKMVKAGKAHKGDGKDVGHKNSSPRDNSMSNLRIETVHDNRGRAGEGGRKKGKRKKKKS